MNNNNLYQLLRSFILCLVVGWIVSKKDARIAGNLDDHRNITKPTLLLDNDGMLVFNQILKRLNRRAIYHRFASVLFLIIIVSFSGYLVNYFKASVRDERIQDLMALVNRYSIAGYDEEGYFLKSTKERLFKRIKEAQDDLKRSRFEGNWLPVKGDNSGMTWGALNGRIGLAVGDQHFSRSIDSGGTWTEARVDGSDGRIFKAHGVGAIAGSDTQVYGWIAGYDGKIARSSGALDNWSSVTIMEKDGKPSDTDTWSFKFDDQLNGWAAGTGGVVSRFNKIDESWKVSYRAAPSDKKDAYSFYQVDTKNDVVAAVGKGAYFVISYDKGLNWKDETDNIINSMNPRQGIANPEYFSAFLFASNKDRNSVILFGSSGRIILGNYDVQRKSIEWRQKKPPTAGLNRFHWTGRFTVDSGVIFAVGDNGVIAISSDSGETWQECQTKDRRTLLFASPAGGDSLYVAGYKGYLARVRIASSKCDEQIESAAEGNIFQLDQSDASNQLAFGDKILRRFSPPPIYAELSNASSEDFVRKITGLASIPSKPEDLDSVSRTVMYAAADRDLADAQTRIMTESKASVGKNATPDAPSLQELILTVGYRALLATLSFFLIRFLVSIYQFHSSQASYYHGRGDAMRALTIMPNQLAEVGAWFSPATNSDVIGDWFGEAAKSVALTSPLQQAGSKEKDKKSTAKDD